MRLYLGLFFCMVFPILGHATVIRVAQDGSGDFTTLQPAADAVANGDTIFIGPGYYRDLNVDPCYPNEKSLMNVGVETVTILGSGAAETILGLEEFPTEGVPIGIISSGFCGASNLVVKDVGFENLQFAIYATYHVVGPGLPSSLSVRECHFEDIFLAIFSDANQIRLLNCLNISQQNGSRFFGSYVGAPIEDILIDGLDSTVLGDAGTHVSVSSHDKFVLQNSNFSGGRHAVASWGNEFRIVDCVMTCEWGIAANASLNNIVDCFVASNEGGIASVERENKVLQLERVVFSHFPDRCLWVLQLDQSSYVRDCVFEPGLDYIVEFAEEFQVDPNETIHLDMTNNWWGTSDPDSIQVLIYDHNDDPEASPYVVDFEPFKTTNPVDVDKTSLGDLKSLYR